NLVHPLSDKSQKMYRCDSCCLRNRSLYWRRSGIWPGIMETLRSQKKGWELTKAAFDDLLECLSPDREQAAAAYEEIRRKLITFFEFRGCLSSQDQADETINRVARRIQEGEIIQASDVASYFY